MPLEPSAFQSLSAAVRQCGEPYPDRRASVVRRRCGHPNLRKSYAWRAAQERLVSTQLSLSEGILQSREQTLGRRMDETALRI
jgi:hypothetical protein